MNLIEHFINGKITKGSSKKTSKVFNPATGDFEKQILPEEKQQAYVGISGFKPLHCNESCTAPINSQEGNSMLKRFFS